MTGKRKIPESVYKQRLKALRQLERGFGTGDGFYVAKLTPAQKRKINREYAKYDALDSPTSRIVKVPRGTPGNVIDSLQEFAQYQTKVSREKVKGVLVPATISTDEKLELIPASKRKKGKSAVVYYKDGRIKTPQGHMIMRDGSVAMYERRGSIFSTQAVDVERIREAVLQYIRKHPDADLWDVYIRTLERELKRLEKQAGELWYLIVAANAPTKFGGRRPRIVELLQSWRDRYRDTSDPMLFVTGLRVFLSREAYTQTHTKVVEDQRIKAREFKRLRQAQRYRNGVKLSKESFHRARVKGRL